MFFGSKIFLQAGEVSLRQGSFFKIRGSILLDTLQDTMPVNEKVLLSGGVPLVLLSSTEIRL